VKDKTRILMDELGHMYVKDALNHALIMRNALTEIYAMAKDGLYNREEDVRNICDMAYRGIKK
jgi:hypothetical protein